MRLAPGQHAVAILIGQGLAVQLVAGTRIKLEVPSQSDGIRRRLFGGLAAIALFQGGQFGSMLGHFARQSHQKPTALDRRQPAPRAVEGGAGGGHGLVNLARLAALDLVKDLPVRGVDDVQGLPRQGGHGFVGDEIQLHGAIVNPRDGLKNHARDSAIDGVNVQQRLLRKPCESKIGVNP
jgi:hypothetical protein